MFNKLVRSDDQLLQGRTVNCPSAKKKSIATRKWQYKTSIQLPTESIVKIDVKCDYVFMMEITDEVVISINKSCLFFLPATVLHF